MLRSRRIEVKMDLGTEKARAKAAEKPLISVSLMHTIISHGCVE